VIATRRARQELEGGRRSTATGGRCVVDEAQAVEGDIGRRADEVLADQGGLTRPACHAATAGRAVDAVLGAEDRDAFVDVDVLVKRTSTHLDGVAAISRVNRCLDGHACFHNQDAIGIFHYGTGVAESLQAQREVHSICLVGEEEGEVFAIAKTATEGVVRDFPDAVAVICEGRREGYCAQIVRRRDILGVDAHGFVMRVGADKHDVSELLVVVDVGRIERDRAPRVVQRRDVSQSDIGGVGDGDADTRGIQAIGGDIRQVGTQHTVQVELGAAETLHRDVRDAEIFQPRIEPRDTVSAGLQAIGIGSRTDQSEVGQAGVVGRDEDAVTAAAGVDHYAVFALAD